jgi:branched-subunit amino acid aminotransferase/4-amino-4-deoxychorismate lyase
VARELGVPVRKESVRLDETGTLDEAFLTSSTRALLPVVHICGAQVGSGKPGPCTLRLRAGYDRLVEREARPAL